jgi:hypothetical protein
VVAVFLVVYNLGHLLIRVWGLRLGWERGSQVGDSLRSLAIPRQAGRVSAVGALLLGALVGMALARSGGAGMWALPAWGLAAVGLLLGSRAGQRSWKLNLWALMGVLALVFFYGWAE